MNYLSITNLIILIEVIIILMIVIITYLIGTILFLQKRTRLRIEKEIESYINHMLTASQIPQRLRFPMRWKQIDIVLQIIKKYDEKPAANWPKLRGKLLRTVLLPLARKKAFSWFTIPQILSAQVFNLCMEEQDVPILSHLLQKKAPIVHLHASIAAIHSEKESLINQVLDSMASMRRLGQSMFLNLFDSMKPKLFNIVENRLLRESNPYIKASCYKILLLYTENSSKAEEILPLDIHSENIELSLTALRLMSKSMPQKAIPKLIHFLEDPRWELRATACKLLGELKEKQAIRRLESCLKDPVWYVRINAANALKNMGKMGLDVLEAQDPKGDRFAYETAMFVLGQDLSPVTSPRT